MFSINIEDNQFHLNEMMDFVEITIKYLPLWAIAGSAVFYVWNCFKEFENNKRQQFFELTKMLDDKNLPMASKLVAIYHLRFHTNHADFISRFCSSLQKGFYGPASEELINELELTKSYMKTVKSKS